jgi:DNA-directed RNA polymerase omega subunit
MRPLPDKIDSKFRFVLLAARRAEQIMRGAQPKVPASPAGKPTRVAMEEVLEEAVGWDYGPPAAADGLAEGLGELAEADAEAAEG